MTKPKTHADRLRESSSRKISQIYRLLGILVVVAIAFFFMNRRDLFDSSVNKFLKLHWSCVNKPLEVRYWSFSSQQARTRFLTDGKTEKSTLVDSNQELTGEQFFKIRCFEGSTFTGKSLRNPWIVLRVRTPDAAETWTQTLLDVNQEMLDGKEILLDCPGEPFTDKQREWTQVL